MFVFAGTSVAAGAVVVALKAVIVIFIAILLADVDENGDVDHVIVFAVCVAVCVAEAASDKLFEVNNDPVTFGGSTNKLVVQ